MKVEVEDEGKIEIPEKSDVETLVERLGYHLDAVVVLHDNEPLPLDTELEEEMKLKVVSVVSGG